MSIIKRTFDSEQFKLNNSKASSSKHKSHLTTDESLMATDYFSHYGTIKSKHNNSSSFSFSHKAATDNKTTFSSIENRTESNIKEPSPFESLITRMNKTVTTKLKDAYTNQSVLFRSQKKNLKQFESTLNSSKNNLDESIHTVYSLFQENTKKYHEQIRFSKENKHNDDECNLMKQRNDKMEKEIAGLEKSTRKMNMDLVCLRKDQQLVWKRCKEASSQIYSQIEDNKRLKTALLLTQLRAEKMKEVLFRYNKKEKNITDQIKTIIQNLN